MSPKTGQTAPMAQSFALHAAAAALLFALSHLAARDDRPVVIDFSLVEQCAPVAAQAPRPPEPEKREVRAQAAARPSAPEVPQPPAPARAVNNVEQAVFLPEPDAAPLPDAAPAPQRRAYTPVLVPVRTRVAPARPAPEAGTAYPAGQAGSAGGTATPGEAREGYLKANFSYIRELVNKEVAYPPLARKMGWEGKVTVGFVVSRDGSVRDVRVVQSSGRDVLDRNAADTVAKASPFPAPPVEAEVVLPVVYRLN